MKKDELLEQAALLGLNIDPKSKLAEIKKSIEEAEQQGNQLAAPDEDTESVSAGADDESENAEPAAAKAGKRSKKGQEAAEDKFEKIARQKGDIEPEARVEEEPKHKRGPAPKARPRIERKGKKYREAAKAVDRSREYPLDEAVKLAQSSSTTTFDATVEIHINLGIDPTQSDQNIRGTIVLPYGTGKTLRVAVYGADEDVKAAKEAGADKAVTDDFLADLGKGVIDFDVLIATPDVMSKLGQYAKLLGPKGLMPNPKSGTVTKNVAQAVKDA